MLRTVLEFVGLFLAGVLAGGEVVVRYGVRGPLAMLDDRSHIMLRQGLIRTLRVLVPAMAMPAFAVSVAVAVVDAGAGGLVFRVVGVAALLVWVLATFFGTVPINAAALNWSPEAPPVTWKAQVSRWERLNTVRTWAALVAFAAFLTALALRTG